MKKKERKAIARQYMQCEFCAKFVKVPGRSAIFSRGYFWHRTCARIRVVNHEVYVDFPSSGKLCPKTILLGGKTR